MRREQCLAGFGRTDIGVQPCRVVIRDIAHRRWSYELPCVGASGADEGGALI